MKVLAIAITNREIPLEVRHALDTQDYLDYNIMINKKETDETKSRIQNIVDNRNETREKALNTNADYFLWVDDDIILPKDAISKLMLQMGEKKTTMDFPSRDGNIILKGTPIPEKFIIGGWYPLEKDWNLRTPIPDWNLRNWNCGKWIADNTFINLPTPEKSVIKIDKIDLGCILMKREVLEKIKFRIDPTRKMNDNIDMCECLMFAIDAQDAGWDLWMSGDVICQHLKNE